MWPGHSAGAHCRSRTLTYRQDSSYTGPYSVYGPGLTYRQDPTSYTGPYSGRLGSTSSSGLTRTDTYSSLRTAATQNGNGKGQGDDVTRSDAGRAPAVGARPRYVRLSISGNAIQAIVIP